MGATQRLAEFIATYPTDALPDSTLHQAKRCLVNALAVALSASRARSSRRLVEWAREEGGAARATIIGSGLRSALGCTALVNAYLVHLQDHDDTHFPTVLHPSAPVWPAVLASAEQRGATGRETLAAFVLGLEACCRVALSVHPWHYDGGWHITGTAGVLGAAAGAGRILALDAGQMTHALGLAGTQAAGVRESFGSDAKPLHAAHAARTGIESAALAESGLTGSQSFIEGRRGFWAVLSPDGHSEDALLAELGERWEISQNGLKPYANGVVSHPIQDAVIALRNEHGLTADRVAAIEARVHPLVLELMDRPEPTRGLEGKFSFQHCAAAALVDGAGGDEQFSDEKVADPLIRSLAAKVTASPDASLGEDETHVRIALVDGGSVETHIEHATGSPQNPLSDGDLETKFRSLVEPVLGPEPARRLLEAAWHVDKAPDVRGLLALATVPGV